jgi:hypothetical protein
MIFYDTDQDDTGQARFEVFSSLVNYLIMALTQVYFNYRYLQSLQDKSNVKFQVIGYVLFTYMLLDQMSCAQNKIALPARL